MGHSLPCPRLCFNLLRGESPRLTGSRACGGLRREETACEVGLDELHMSVQILTPSRQSLTHHVIVWQM